MNEDKETLEQNEEEQEEQNEEVEGQLYGNAAADILDTAFDMQEIFRQYGLAEERQIVEAEHFATGLVHSKQAVKMVFELEVDEFMIWWFEQIGKEVPEHNDAMTFFDRAFLQKGCEIYMTQRKNAAMSAQTIFMQQLAKEEAGDEKGDETSEAENDGHAPALEIENAENVTPMNPEEKVTDVPLDEEEPIETEDESKT